MSDGINDSERNWEAIEIYRSGENMKQPSKKVVKAWGIIATGSDKLECVRLRKEDAKFILPRDCKIIPLTITYEVPDGE